MTGEDVSVLRSLEGAAYLARRDAVIAGSPHLLSEVALFVDSPAWGQAVTARILINCVKEAALRKTIGEAIATADVAGAQRTMSGLGGLLGSFAERARVEWGAGAVPFAWETLLKRGGELPAVELLFSLAILRGLPEPLSVDVILSFLETREDQGIIEAGARTLAAFPTAMVQTKVEGAYRRHDLIAGALQRLRVDIFENAKEGR